MKIEVEDLLKHSIVISIDDSIYDRFKHLFLHHSLTPCPRLYRGMKLHGVDWGSDSAFASFGQTQCMYSHLSIVKMAKFLDWPFVCIFEDDAYPCKDCRQWLEDSLEDLPDDIKCLVLGHCYIEKHKYENSTKISCCDMLFGSQAYVIFKNGYDNYVQLTEKQNCLADRILDRMPNSYCIDHNLFIQYNNKISVVSHRDGYIWWKDKNANNYDDNTIFSQFSKIEDIDYQNENNNIVVISKKKTIMYCL